MSCDLLHLIYAILAGCAVVSVTAVLAMAIGVALWLLNEKLAKLFAGTRHALWAFPLMMGLAVITLFPILGVGVVLAILVGTSVGGGG